MLEAKVGREVTFWFILFLGNVYKVNLVQSLDQFLFPILPVLKILQHAYFSKFLKTFFKF